MRSGKWTLRVFNGYRVRHSFGEVNHAIRSLRLSVGLARLSYDEGGWGSPFPSTRISPPNQLDPGFALQPRIRGGQLRRCMECGIPASHRMRTLNISSIPAPPLSLPATTVAPALILIHSSQSVDSSRTCRIATFFSSYAINL